MKLEFFISFRKKIAKHQISWKFVEWEPSISMQTNRQTDMTKLMVTFRNFPKAPKSAEGDISDIPEGTEEIQELHQLKSL